MALADALPDRVQAFTGLPSSGLFYGTDADGGTYNDHLFQGGGQGASSHGDGKSGLLWPTSAANTSIELFETRAPILVLEKAYLADSAGPGCQRGGLGQVIRARRLFDDGRPAQVGLYPNGVAVGTPGLFGGKPGALARAAVHGADTVDVSDLGIGALVTLASPNDVAELEFHLKKRNGPVTLTPDPSSLIYVNDSMIAGPFELRHGDRVGIHTPAQIVRYFYYTQNPVGDEIVWPGQALEDDEYVLLDDDDDDDDDDF